MRPRPNDPCWCGSGKKYKKCHGPIDAQKRSAVRGSQRPSLKAGVVGPGLPVPPEIVPPEYAETGRPTSVRRASIIDDPVSLAGIQAACTAAREVLEETLAAVAPGVTTEELDRIAHEASIARGAYPSPLNYQGYPKSICTSVNEVICHGIPDNRPLADGDIINCDITVYLNGYHGDNSAMALVGSVDEAGQKLVRVTEESLWAGIRAVRPGGVLSDVGRAIQSHAESNGFSVVRDFVGHGIGEHFHMDPQVPHYASRHARDALLPGMVFTIEPMINEGDWRHRLWPDNWTAVTVDGGRSAQFEHTVRVTDSGIDVLTARPE